MKANLTTAVVLVALCSLTAPAAFAASIAIDDLTDLFPPEEFITGYSGDTINQVSTRYGLEVGAFYQPESPDHDEPGETMPDSHVSRSVESQTQTGLAGVLGGQRTGTLTKTDSTWYAEAKANIGYGWLTLSNNAGARSTLLLEYGDVMALNADFSNQEATGGYFALEDWQVDHHTVQATLSLTSGATTQSKTISLAAASYDNPLDYQIAFSEFPSIDFSDVDVIALELVCTADSQDWGLRGFKAVPEPATLALLGLGGMILLARRRHSRA